MDSTAKQSVSSVQQNLFLTPCHVICLVTVTLTRQRFSEYFNINCRFVDQPIVLCISVDAT